MQKMTLFTVLMVVLFLVSCEKKENEKTQDRSKKVQLISTPITEIEILTAGNVALSIVDEFLIVQKREVNIIIVYDRSTYKKVTSFGKNGSGPQEFEFPQMLSHISRDSINNDPVISVHDIQKNRLSRINMNRAVQDSTYTYEQMTFPQLNYYLPIVYYMDDDMLIAMPEQGSRFMIYDFNNPKEVLVPYPDDLDFSPPVGLLGEIYTSAIAVNKTKDRIAAAPFLAGKIDFFTSDGKFLSTKVFDEEIITEQDLKQKPPNIKLFITQIKAKGDLIFALNNNFPIGQLRNWNGKHRQQLLIFNWEGQLLKTLTLDHRKIESFAVDTKQNKIIAFSKDEEQFNLLEYTYESLK